MLECFRKTLNEFTVDIGYSDSFHSKGKRGAKVEFLYSTLELHVAAR
jgi:hypothetical protein